MNGVVPSYVTMCGNITRVWHGVIDGLTVEILFRTSFIERCARYILVKVGQTVPVLFMPIATISDIKYNECAQVGAVAVEPAWRESIYEHRIPDEIASPIQVARQMRNLGTSEGTVLVICDGADVLCAETDQFLTRRRLALVARTAEIMEQKCFHVRASSFLEREMHLPKGTTVAQRIHTIAWLMTVKIEWEQNKTVNTVPIYKSGTDEVKNV